jgi:hypothetical protein
MFDHSPGQSAHGSVRNSMLDEPFGPLAALRAGIYPAFTYDPCPPPGGYPQLIVGSQIESGEPVVIPTNVSQPVSPSGADESHIRRVIEQCLNEAEDRAPAEDDVIYEAAGESLMVVPTKLVPAIRKLIARFA